MGYPFLKFDIFKAIGNYELMLHTHSVPVLKRSFLDPKSGKYITGRDSVHPKNKQRLRSASPHHQQIISQTVVKRAGELGCLLLVK